MWEVIGHQRQIQYLEKDLANDSLKHAYLFAGPEKIGKFTLVKRLAKMLQSDGVHDAQIQHQIDLGVHPDTIFLRDDGESIKVEQMRQIVQKTSLTFQSKYYLICIENIERMTDESANALLKTLEEPPPQVVFLLTTTNMNMLLPTVLSRVFFLELGGVHRQELEKYLREKFPDAASDAIEKVINLAGNKPGLAIEMLGDRNILEYYTSLYALIVGLFDRFSRSDRLSLAESLANEETYKLKDFFELSLFLLRSSFLHTIQHVPHQVLQGLSLRSIMQLIESFQTAQSLIERNINKKLVLENLMLGIRSEK